MKVGYTVIESNVKKLRNQCDKIVYVERNAQKPQDFLEFVRINQKENIYTYALKDIGLQLVQLMPALRELKKNGKFIYFLQKGSANSLSDVAYNNLLLELGYVEKQAMSALGITNNRGQGRPKIDQAIIETIRDLSYNQKRSIREIATICSVSVGTVHKYVTKSAMKSQ